MSANLHAVARLACAVGACLLGDVGAASGDESAASPVPEAASAAEAERTAPAGEASRPPDLHAAPAPPSARARDAPSSADARQAPAKEPPALRAQPVPAAARPEAAEAADPARVRLVRPRAGAKESSLEIELHGRVNVGLALDEREAWARDLGMRDARISLEARLPRILTVVEADLSARSLLRDAFVRLDGPATTRLQAGHFKAPFSARRLESSWRLPLVRRGLVDDYVVERNGIGGRRFGATGAVRPWSGRLELAAGAFVGETGSGDDEPRADDLAARVALRPWRGLELAATGYRAARDDGPAREAATAYLKLDLGRLETTVEGLAGHLVQGSFAAATALVAWTFRPGSGALRITPVAGAEVLALRDGASGRGQAATVGAVLSWIDGLKVKVEGERARRPGDEVPANAVALEIATRF